MNIQSLFEEAKLLSKHYIKNYFGRIVLYVLALFLLWYYGGVRNFIYKQILSTSRTAQPEIWQKEDIQEVSDTLSDAVFNGYSVKKVFKKKYALSGMLGYHDDNTTFMKKHFWNALNPAGEIYNEIASHDLTILWGKMAAQNNLKNLKVSHEQNMAYLKCENLSCYYSAGENNNFHIIPANKRLDKALSILPKHKYVPIYVEGYLIFWYGTGEYARLEMESALSATEISHQKAGGQQSGLCYQLYLTKFIYDGYVFE